MPILTNGQSDNNAACTRITPFQMQMDGCRGIFKKPEADMNNGKPKAPRTDQFVSIWRLCPSDNGLGLALHDRPS